MEINFNSQNYLSVNSKWNFVEVSEQGSFFWASRNEYNKSYAMIKTEKKVKLLSGFSRKLYQSFKKFVFPSWSKWVQYVLCYDQNWKLD